MPKSIEKAARNGIVKVSAREATLAQLKAHARWAARADGALVLEISGDLPPERILKFVEWANDNYRVKAVIRHAELKDYVERAAATGAVAAGAVVLAKLAGWAISWPAALLLVIAGMVIGAGSTPLSLKVYKYRGKTRLQLAGAT